ncbi:MAG: PAS domain-containing protein [Candidatus Tectomicrobia bacterium]|uniref:histidine kinase n=1 Tax=Tectimicrobiota bacterium TaxID=2528274 RepID=A0A932CNB8_UNCTE|nr:PAS domain-containing protein [Candidatus Tectomicrobia bacterium]
MFTHWRRFIESQPPESPLSRTILESRERVRAAGADPEADLPRFRHIPEEEIGQRLHANQDLLAIALPHLNWWAASLAHGPHAIYLVDGDGILLYATGSPPEAMRDSGLLPGHDWSERAIGPNAAGTALVAGQPVVLLGCEPLSPLWRDATGVAAPIRNPEGAVIGALAIGTPGADSSPERLVMAAHIAYGIERELAGRKATSDAETRPTLQAERRAVGAEEDRRTLEALMEYIPEGITIADAPEVKIRMVSRYGQQLTGRPREVIEEIPVEEHVEKWGIYHADGLTRPAGEELPLTRATRQGEVVKDEEWVLRQPDGQAIPILCNAGPIRDSQGQIIGGVVAWRDITERKRAEEERQRLYQEVDCLYREVDRHRRLLELVIEIAPAGIAVFEGRNLQLKWANPAYQRSLEEPYRSREIAGMRFQDHFPHAEESGLVDLFRRVAATGEPYHNPEYEFSGFAQGLTYWYWSLLPLAMEGQAVPDLLLLLVETTEQVLARKRIEELAHALAAERTFLETVIQQMPMGVILVEPSGKFLLGNEQVSQIFRHPILPSASLEEYSEWKGVHPDGRPYRPQEWPLARSLSTGEVVWEEEIEILRGDGTRGIISSCSTPIRDPEGEILGGVLTFQDITERKQIEAALRHANERLRFVLSSITDAYFVLDAQWRFVEINPVAEKMIFGRSAHELLGRIYWEAYPQVVDTEFYRQYQIAFAEGRPVHFEGRSGIVDKWFETHAYPRDEYLEIYVRDITARKRAEEALEEANRRKDEFLAMLAHELRNPLAAIASAVQILRLRGSEDPMLRFAQEATERQAQQMKRLLDDLLDVSRVGRGKITLKKEPVDLVMAVSHAIQTVSPQIQERRHELSITLPSEPLRLEADPVRLEQVLSNLLSNAAKYTPQGGRIWLSAECQGNEAVVRVRDNGIGISSELLPHVFDLFVQAERSSDRSQGGLGIGLALVHNLVEMHGGRVEASSEGPGKGSEFVVRLPALSAASAGQRPAISSTEAVASASRRILLVDDNQDGARMLALILEMQGHQVHIVHDGPSALVAAGEYRPDVVLLDIGLPGMDGYEVARRLRQRADLPPMRLVAITGYGQEEDRQQAREAGFDHHLIKPIDPEELLRLLSNAPEGS